jgi:hypothetical protein
MTTATLSKSIHKVKPGEIFIYNGVEYRRVGSALRGIELLTGKPRVFLGVEIVEIYEDTL